jgi:two-component system sensor histidine kinase KdpD
MNARSFPIRIQLEAQNNWRHYLATIFLCCASAAIMTPFIGHLDLANIVMIFLLAVVVISLRLGRSCAVLSAVLNVLLF